jgi:PPOX class probable F420-dependent enzyme
VNEPAPQRPRFTPAYGVPESADGLLPWSWVAKRMEGSHNYWLTTTKPDGAPHAMPVWGLWVDGTFVFGTSPKSRKARNFARDPRVVVHVEHDVDVVILEGEVETAELDARIAGAYEAKYDYRPNPDSADEGWYRLRPRAAQAWDRDFPRTVTQFAFE